MNLVHYFRLLGVGILALLLLDYAALLIPPQFTNPVWEFQTVGQIVERIWAPVLAYVLFFIPFIPSIPLKFDGPWLIRKWSMQTARFLSHLALAWAIVYLLMMPLLLNNSIRIYRNNQAGLAQQSSQQKTQLAAIEEQIEQLTDRNLESMIEQAQATSDEANREASNPGEIRQQLLDQTQQRFIQGQQQLQNSFEDQQRNLIKSTVKWFFGAIIGSALMFTVWRLSNELLGYWPMQ
ncbi:HpsJ-like protein, cyanoexosortase A-associated [Prochlorothrix hollandica]|uniref:HpsJ-like protein, cyanoexosortase A-associated n=1 Tax=Prochlorothrix hollandica TaxID=1223 RepID=UPI000377CD10|nr:HpsJ family protein [Prochlorothrix hollandica]